MYISKPFRSYSIHWFFLFVLVINYDKWGIEIFVIKSISVLIIIKNYFFSINHRNCITSNIINCMFSSRYQWHSWGCPKTHKIKEFERILSWFFWGWTQTCLLNQAIYMIFFTFSLSLAISAFLFLIPSDRGMSMCHLLLKHEASA